LTQRVGVGVGVEVRVRVRFRVMIRLTIRARVGVRVKVGSFRQTSAKFHEKNSRDRIIVGAACTRKQLNSF
jgi:hypothetical protein